MTAANRWIRVAVAMTVLALGLAPAAFADDDFDFADGLQIGEPYASPALKAFTIEADEGLTKNNTVVCRQGGADRRSLYTDWTTVRGNGRDLTATVTAAWDSSIGVFPTTIAAPTRCNTQVKNTANAVGWTSAAGQDYGLQVGACVIYPNGLQNTPQWCATAPDTPDGFPSDYSLVVTSAPPSNDLRANALPYGPANGQNRFDNHGSTVDGEGTPSCTLPTGQVSRYRSTVWFKYTPDKFGTATFTATPVLSDRTDTVLAAYKGTGTAQLGCDDNPADINGDAQVSVAVEKGQTYFVQVGSYYDPAFSSAVPPYHQGVFTYRVVFSTDNNDGDPEKNATDCAPDDPGRYHGNPDVFNDGIDQDCDGKDDHDGDNDGYDYDGGDCNDGDASISPKANEIAGNKIDENCDGQRPAAELAPKPGIQLYSAFVKGRGRIFGDTRISPVGPGFRIQFKCTGRGCGAKRKKTIVVGSQKSVRTHWTNRRILKAGAAFEISVWQPNANRIGVYQRSSVAKGNRAKTRTCDLQPTSPDGVAFTRTRCGKR